ncbi:hypothetical protein HMI54_008908 [Coelomomyces lativittatus]|nr:hypothetical protein HMI54_008908 [Coelomomyces lativittatus]
MLVFGGKIIEIESPAIKCIQPGSSEADHIGGGILLYRAFQQQGSGNGANGQVPFNVQSKLTSVGNGKSSSIDQLL